jgi:hypothetical protein
MVRHITQPFGRPLVDGYLGDWYRRKSITFTELYGAARYVKNVFLLHSMDAIFIFNDGYILAYDVYQFKPIWATRPTGQMYVNGLVFALWPSLKIKFRFSSAVSKCDRFVALSTTASCKLQPVLGMPPRDSFIRAPVGLVKLFFLDCPDLLLGTNQKGDSIVWNGVSGDVLHVLNREDGQILHPVVINRAILSAMEYLTFVLTSVRRKE